MKISFRDGITYEGVVAVEYEMEFDGAPYDVVCVSIPDRRGMTYMSTLKEFRTTATQYFSLQNDRGVTVGEFENYSTIIERLLFLSNRKE